MSAGSLPAQRQPAGDRRLPSWSPQSHIFRLITAHLRAVVWGTGLINKAELGVVTLPSHLALPACCVIGQNPP